MTVLNNIKNSFVGDIQVKEIHLGNNLVWKYDGGQIISLRIEPTSLSFTSAEKTAKTINVFSNTEWFIREKSNL